MANYNLAGQKIKNTYQQVAQVDGTTLVNGSGAATPIATSSIVNFPTEVSRSAAAAGFGSGGTATWPVSGTPSGLVSSSAQISYTGITNVPSGIISSSAQVNLSLATGTAANATSASYATTALSASYAPGASLPSGLISSSAQVDLSLATGVAANATSASYATSALSASYAPSTPLPSGLVSSSAQISYNGITDVPSGIVSSSSQVSYSGITGVPSGIVSGAAQLPEIGTNTTNIASLTAATSSYLTSLPSGVVSSSAQVDLASAYGTAATATSASYALTASYVPGIAAPGLVSGTGTNSMKSADTLTAVTASAIGQDTIALGDNAVAESIGAISIGKNSEARGDYSVAIGYNADVFDTNRDYSTAVGSEARLAQNSVGIGYHAYGVGSDCVAVGMNSNVAGFGAVGVGAEAQAFANYSVALGYQQQANNYNYEININGKLKYNASNQGEFTLNGAVKVPTQTLTGAGSSVAVDCGLSNYFYLNNGGSTTTISNPTNIQNGATYTFSIDNGQNITWSSAYKFPNGVAPTLTSGTDVISFVSIGGTYLYGTAQYNFL